MLLTMISVLETQDAGPAAASGGPQAPQRLGQELLERMVASVSAPAIVALVVGALLFALVALTRQGSSSKRGGAKGDSAAALPLLQQQQQQRIRAFIGHQVAAHDVVLFVASAAASSSLRDFQLLFGAILSSDTPLSVVDLAKTAQGKKILQKLQETYSENDGRRSSRTDFLFVREAHVGNYARLRSLLVSGELESALMAAGGVRCDLDSIRVDAAAASGFFVPGPQQCFQSVSSPGAGDVSVARNFVETQPLDTPEQLLRYTSNAELAAASASGQLPRIPLAKRARIPTRRSKLLVCHDMKGGYLGDRFTQGSANFDAYRFYQWDLVDLFVYFGHHLVCIPPTGWVTAGHRNGTRVLGAFVTEGESGAKMALQLFSNKATAQAYASELVAIATLHGFDGWLVNIENSVPEALVPNVSAFLRVLQRDLKASSADAQVIWYASLARDGRRKHQVRLDVDGAPFFRDVDGLYADYGWTADDAKFSAAFDLNRRFDIYMGVDVFSRHDTLCGGKMDCDKALRVAWNSGVSAALFAPGWTHECYQRETSEDFVTVEDHFWRMIRSSWKPKSPCFDALGGPDSFYSAFNVGRGKKLWVDGQQVDDSQWSNLQEMELQPMSGLHAGVAVRTRDSEVSAVLTHERAFQGGACVAIQGRMPGKDKAYFKLFDVDMELSARRIMEISYTAASNDQSVVLLVLTVCPGMDRPVHQIFLRSSDSNTDSSPSSTFTSAVAGASPGKHFYSPVSTRSYSTTGDNGRMAWVKKTYRLGGIIWDQKHIVEIGVLCTTTAKRLSTGTTTVSGAARGYEAYLGEVCLAGHADVRTKASVGTIGAEPEACINARARSFQRIDSEHVTFDVEWEFTEDVGESVAYVLLYRQDADGQRRVLLGKSFGRFYRVESCPWPAQGASAAPSLLRIELVSVSWTGTSASAGGTCHLYLQE